jgi:hypothetical protein
VAQKYFNNLSSINNFLNYSKKVSYQPTERLPGSGVLDVRPNQLYYTFYEGRYLLLTRYYSDGGFKYNINNINGTYGIKDCNCLM